LEIEATNPPESSLGRLRGTEEERGSENSCHEQRHTVASGLHTINSQPWIFLFDLSRFDRRQCFYRAQTRVFCQGHGNRVEGFGKCSHRVLFETRTLHVVVSLIFLMSGKMNTNFDSSFLNRKRTCDFGSPTPINDAIVLY
jgi:hypothetical protein